MNEAIRAQFPALSATVHGRPLVWLDSAATAHKPRAVLDAMNVAAATSYANVHRGVHELAVRATAAYEGARADVARFLGNVGVKDVVFTRGTTESLNLVARAWGDRNLRPGSRVLVGQMEHHSAIVPWQEAAKRTGAELVPIPFTADIVYDLERYARLLEGGAAVVVVAHASNAFGTVHPVAEMAAMARAAGARVVVDGAQGAVHGPPQVEALGADFYAFSGHKLYGPTGIGVLWARPETWEETPPFLHGGEMIRSVRFSGTTYADRPARYEAGTPPILEAIGLGAAIRWLEGVGWEAIVEHEGRLTQRLLDALDTVPGLTWMGRGAPRVPLASFVLDGIHPHDVGSVLDREGVAVRTGHHCAQPAMEALGRVATTRASLGVTSVESDIDALIAGLHVVRRRLG